MADVLLGEYVDCSASFVADTGEKVGQITDGTKCVIGPVVGVFDGI